MRETHEKLKVGNVELLNCYYAHAAENNRFQRRCYWLLDSDEGVVLVHYLDTTTVVGGRGGAKAAGLSAPGSNGGAADGEDQNGFRNLFGYEVSGSGYEEGSVGGMSGSMGGMSGSMGGMSGASPMMQSPARPGQYHPEVYQQYPQQQAVGQYGHHGYGTPTMHYPHGDSDPHALYHAAQEQFNGGAESESWFDSVLASEDEAGEETGPGGAPGRGGVHRRGAVPFRQSSGRAAPLREGSNRSIVSLGSGPPLDHGYLDMGQDESSNGPHFDLLKEFAVDQIAEAQGIKVEGMPVESAAAAAAAAAAAGPDIGTAFPGEYTSDIADGVTSMAELESKIASLKETLVRVASVNADASPEQVARLEQDMAALERGAAAMRPAPGSVGGGGGGGGGAKPGHRRGSSFGSGTRARPPRARPVIWDGHDKDEDDADREDDGDDDDDDGGDDNEGTAEGALSPLAKAAAATRRPRGADGGRGAHRAAALAAQQQQRTSGFQRVPSRVSEGSEMDADHNSDGDDGASPRAPSPALRAAQMRAAAAASHARYNRARQPFIPPAQQGSPILWAIDDFSPEWDAETGGGKVLVTGTPGTGLPEGLSLCCVFGDVEVPAEQVSPGVLRCRAPPMNAGRVPFYISCLGSGKRPASDIRTFEYREAGAGGARDKRAAEIRLTSGVTERDFQLRLVHLLIGADRSSKASGGGGGSGSGGSGGPGGGGGGGGGGNGSTGSGNGPSDGKGSGGGGGGNTGSPDNRNGGGSSESRDVHGSPASPGRPGSQSGGMGGGAGAGFTRRAVAALNLGADPALDPNMSNLSDEDVGKVFKTALEARLRHAIAAEAKHHRARAEGIVPNPGYVQPKSAYARVDAGGMGLIHCVAALGMKWAIPAMTKCGCDVNQPDRRNRTALHWAAAKGHEDTVATLLASGADIRAMARWGAGGYTAADLAAALGHGGIAAYISETSLAASLSNISLYGGAQGPATGRSLRLATFDRKRQQQQQQQVQGLTTPLMSGAGITPLGVKPGAGPTANRTGRAQRDHVKAVPMRSLLLATETEVTATDAVTSQTEVETEAEFMEGGGTGTERREAVAAGMIQLAFRKHSVRRRKSRKKGGELNTVTEGVEAGAAPRTGADRDVKKDVKKVVKKAEKAAQKITDSLRSLKVSKTSTGAPELGKRRLGERSGVGVGGGGVAPIPESEAMDVSVEEGDGLPPEGTADEFAMRSPSGEALAALRRRIAQLQDRAVALQGEIRAADYRGRQDRLQTLMPGGHHQRRRAADIMQLISAGVGGGGGGGEDGGAAARAVEWERAVLERANSSKDSLDEVYRSGGGASNRLVKSANLRGRRQSHKSHKSHSDDGNDSNKRSTSDTNNDDDSDDDDEEENVQQAVARIQAITRSREARDQYLRLRMVTQSMQERRDAIARGEAVKREEDEDGLDDVDVEEDEEEDE